MYVYTRLPMFQYIDVDGEWDDETVEDRHQHLEPVI